MSGPLALLLIFAASTLAVAAYLLSGLDSWQPQARRRDARTLRRYPAARHAYRQRGRRQ